MSSDKETTDYSELRPGDRVQVGDQWLDQFGQWHFYTGSGNAGGFVNSGVKARRPIRATHQTTYEEVPGSRTTQETIINPQCERIAYEELRPGTEVQAGDQYRNTQGRWVEYSIDTSGVPIVGPAAMARRPHNITAMEKYRGDLIDDIQHVIGERNEARKERDLARSEVARLSTELWARKPLEERVTSLTEELAQAREVAIAERNEAERLLGEARMDRDKARSDQKAIQAYRDTALQELTQAREASEQLLQTITDNAAHFADHTKVLEQERDDLQTALIESRLEQQRKVAAVMEVCKERDEVEAELKRVQEVVCNLYNEPTARQVQQMLRAWATELDWSAGCFDSVGRDEIDTIQRTLIAVIERIEGMINPEGGTDGN